MPEGDTVWRTAQRLNEALAGDPLVHADLRWPSLALADLRGAVTLEIRARGKHLLHRLDNGLTLHSHLRMEGQWRIESTATLSVRRLADDDLRAVLGTTRWTALGLRLGMLDLVTTSDEASLVGHLGPDVLGSDWDPVIATSNLAASASMIGAALLDQRNLAGVGTIYAAESLFLQRLSPWALATELPTTAVAELVERAHQLLDIGRRNPLQSTTGRTRRGETTFVHGRSGRPCLRCGTIIRLGMVGTAPQERAMFYCPTCQDVRKFRDVRKFQADRSLPGDRSVQGVRTDGRRPPRPSPSRGR